MYSDRKKNRRIRLLPLAAVLVLVLLLALCLLKKPGRDVDEESIRAMGEAVRQSALQCYVVEGVYPPDLAYLEENYGLQINTEEYIVSYEAFASNLPPTVMIVRRS